MFLKVRILGSRMLDIIYEKVRHLNPYRNQCPAASDTAAAAVFTQTSSQHHSITWLMELCNYVISQILYKYYTNTTNTIQIPYKYYKYHTITIQIPQIPYKYHTNTTKYQTNTTNTIQIPLK